MYEFKIILINIHSDVSDVSMHFKDNITITWRCLLWATKNAPLLTTVVFLKKITINLKQLSCKI